MFPACPFSTCVTPKISLEHTSRRGTLYIYVNNLCYLRVPFQLESPPGFHAPASRRGTLYTYIYVYRVVLNIVSKLSINRNIELSMYRAECVWPSIPWHARVFYPDIDIERKLRCVKYRNRIDYIVCLSVSYRTPFRHPCPTLVQSAAAAAAAALCVVVYLVLLLLLLLLLFAAVRHRTLTLATRGCSLY